jgi:hypothetical protein
VALERSCRQPVGPTPFQSAATSSLRGGGKSPIDSRSLLGEG